MEVQKIRTNLWLQILLFLNVYFAPVWITSSIYYFWSQQLIISSIEEILTITALVVGTPAEISRLYFGYSGNLREQIPDLAAFWILTSFVRLPIQCYLLFTQHTLALLIPFIVQLVAMIFIILQIFIGFFVIRVFSKTRAKQFRLETLINQQKFTSTKIPDLAAFWILTSFVRLPIQCYLLFTQHTLALLIPFIVQLVAMIFIILQIFIGFFVIRVFSKTRAKQFRLETLINQQKFTSTEVISSIQ